MNRVAWTVIALVVLAVAIYFFGGDPPCDWHADAGCWR